LFHGNNLCYNPIIDHLMICSTCRLPRDRKNQRICKKCHAAYMRKWRKFHPLTDKQKKKDNCRSYANTYLRRGKLKKEPCSCGNHDTQMHHPDYNYPLNVIWMCRPCHLKLHSPNV